MPQKIIHYTVKPGDTLYSIAAQKLGNGNEWHAIAELNEIQNPKLIRPGQDLEILIYFDSDTFNNCFE
jgi:nucleoid-associated protein YgaU